ncbi:MAG: rhomboid family intramembrane serine protease [Methanococci archaeon]|nr:rhomboid family intramembrane serine protease [Methanococci archaeon]
MSIKMNLNVRGGGKVINFIIIGICVVMFILSKIFPQMYLYFALYPNMAFSMPWQLITSIFMHATITHLLLNMFVLFFFGTYLERLIGAKKYILVFLISGIVGNLAYILYCHITGSYLPSVGSSGAIFGVMGALAILHPRLKVVIFPIPVPISIRVAVGLFALIDLILLPYSFKTGIAHISHLAGLITGLIFGEVLKKDVRNLNNKRKGKLRLKKFKFKKNR